MLFIDRIMTDAVLVLTAPATAAANELTAAKAVVLGLVEGITEYLPVISTGHLLVTQKLLDVGDTDATKDAADTYAITIQAGAILAVVAACTSDGLRAMASGLVGRDPEGRHVLVALVDRVPSRRDRRRRAGEADQGSPVRRRAGDRRRGSSAVSSILVASPLAARRDRPGASRSKQITVRTAVIIGAAQILALWPGTSRSLVTILAALVLGISMSAAVEFSFLLGLATLERGDRVRGS